MEHLLRAFQRRLQQRKLYRPAVWLTIKEFLKPKALYPELLQIKIFERRCDVYLGIQEDKPKRFLQKAALLEQINKKLADDGREVQFNDLRIK